MRLFIAIDCNVLSSYFHSLQKLLPSSTRKVSTFHLTLQFIGDVSTDCAFQIISSLSTISFTSFSLEFDHLSLFSHKKREVFWAGTKHSKQLLELQQSISNVLSRFGCKQFKFVPHVTLSRSNKPSSPFHARTNSISSKKMHVRSFALIQSTLTPTGPAYKTIQIFERELCKN